MTCYFRRLEHVSTRHGFVLTTSFPSFRLQEKKEDVQEQESLMIEFRGEFVELSETMEGGEGCGKDAGKTGTAARTWSRK